MLCGACSAFRAARRRSRFTPTHSYQAIQPKPSRDASVHPGTIQPMTVCAAQPSRRDRRSEPCPPACRASPPMLSSSSCTQAPPGCADQTVPFSTATPATSCPISGSPVFGEVNSALRLARKTRLCCTLHILPIPSTTSLMIFLISTSSTAPLGRALIIACP